MAALIDFVRLIIPGWANKAPRAHWGDYLDVAALFVDALVELADEARTASIPGQLELDGVPNLGGFWSVDALDLIGEDRMVVRGLAESPGAYALRCRQYLDGWALSGLAFGLLKEVAGVLSTPGQPAPLLRIFTTSGRWYTLHPDGTIRVQTPAGDGFFLSPDGTSGPDTTLAQAIDWDSLADPQPPGWGDTTRFWVVIYCPTNLPYLATISGHIGDGRTVGMGLGTPDAATIGTCAPIQHVETVRGVVIQRRASGFKCSHIIEAFDASSFNPDGSSSLYPDGTWGWPGKVVSGEMVPARDLTARYWRAEPGGIAGT